MPAGEDKRYFYKMNIVNKTCYTANIVYLFFRLLYLILFLVAKLYTLVYITAGTMLIYGLFFILLKKKKYFIYALFCGNEFFIFIALMNIFIGFNSGFALYLIGLCVVSFFTTYFSKVRNVKGSIVWAIICATLSLTLFFVDKFTGHQYETPSWLETTLLATHLVIVFAFIVAYLVTFVLYASSLEKMIMNESRTDELTQINNRYGLYDYFDQQLDKSNQLLALFDIDNFKKINDTYGHVYGDYILKRVAEITTVVLNDSFFARYGGEEFVIVLKKDENISFFDRLEKLRKAIEEEIFMFENVKTVITITIGANEYIKGIALEKWVEMADEKMYSGKKSGKNKVVM